MRARGQPLTVLLREIVHELRALVRAVNNTHRPGLIWHVGPATHAGGSVAAGEHHRFPPRHHQGEITMSFTLLDDQKVSLSVQGVDDVGVPVPLTGTPAYSVDDATVLTLVDNGDGTAVVSATGKIGSATVSVVDAETDGQSFIGSLAIDVVGSGVTAITVVPGTPTHV